MGTILLKLHYFNPDYLKSCLASNKHHSAKWFWKIQSPTWTLLYVFQASCSIVDKPLCLASCRTCTAIFTSELNNAYCLRCYSFTFHPSSGFLYLVVRLIQKGDTKGLCLRASLLRGACPPMAEGLSHALWWGQWSWLVPAPGTTS